MYGLLDLQVTTQNAQGVVQSANITSLIAAESETIDLLASKGTTITDVLVKGIFIILFVATFATVGIVFLLRIVMFVLLLIFSPVGFVASIFPGTQRFANMWWEALLKWTFIGPIVVLMLYVALAFITTFRGSLDSATTGVDADFFDGFGSTMILYTAALAILWAGMIAAQQIGGGMATAAISRSRKVGAWTARRGWRGAKQLGRLGDNASVAAQRHAGVKKPLSTGRLLGRARGVTQGIKEGAKRQNDQFVSRRQAGEALGARAVGSQYAVENYNKKEKQRFKDEEFKNTSTNQIIEYAKDDTNTLRQEAAREQLASDKESIKDPEMLAKALNAMGNDVENAAKLISTATTKGAFSNVGTSEYDDLQTAVRTSGMNTDDQKRVIKDVDKKYTENGNVHVLVTHDIRSGSTPKDALENRLNISNKDAASQDKMWEGIDRDTNLQDYVKDNYVPNPQAHQDLFKQMSPKTRKAVSDVGLSP